MTATADSNPRSDSLPTVRGARDDEPGLFVFGGIPYDTGRHTGMLIVRRADLARCLASDLDSSLRLDGGPESVHITDDSETDYRDEESPVLDVWFEAADEHFSLMIDFRAPQWLWDADSSTDTDDQLMMEELLRPILDRRNLTFVEHDLYGSTSALGAHLQLTYNPADRTLGDLVSAGEDIIALLEATRGGALSLTTTSALARSGRLGALLGQPEGKWFDAKTTHYDLATARGKISLAQSVARFCNGDDGGLVVVGLECSVEEGVEAVSKLTPVPFDPSQATRYRKIIDQLLYPFPVGLDVTVVPTADKRGMFVLIELPPQPEHNKPYLVSGAIIDEKVQGEFISVVQRRDDGSEPLKASMIHAWIVTGRALIQRGQIPGDANPG